MIEKFSAPPASSGPAKILNFPPRGRYAVRGAYDEAGPVEGTQLPRAMRVASGSGWYHDEAIQQAMKEALSGERRGDA
jgi:hypothetical protein